MSGTEAFGFPVSCLPNECELLEGMSTSVGTVWMTVPFTEFGCWEPRLDFVLVASQLFFQIPASVLYFVADNSQVYIGEGFK